MPELANRDQHEEELSAVLLGLMDQQRERLDTLLGTQPDLENVPGSYWDHLRTDLRGPLINKLIEIYLLGADQQASDLDHTLSPSDIAANALVWSSGHVDGLLDKFMARSQQMAQAAIAQYHADHDRVAMLASLLLILGDTRADGIAITETTAANTAGERRAASDYVAWANSEEARRAEVENERGGTSPLERRNVDRFSRRLGVTLKAAWNTEKDSKVCPICKPLDGTTEATWGRVAPEGPPAHPRCRCALLYSVSDSQN